MASSFSTLRFSCSTASLSNGSAPFPKLDVGDIRGAFFGDVTCAPSNGCVASLTALPWVLIGMLFLVGERDGDGACVAVLRTGISLSGDNGNAGFKIDLGAATALCSDPVSHASTPFPCFRYDILFHDFLNLPATLRSHRVPSSYCAIVSAISMSPSRPMRWCRASYSPCRWS